MKISRLLLIGGVEKNAGKTTLSTRIIRKILKQNQLSYGIYGVKGTILRDVGGKKGYSIWEENDSKKLKDTGRLLAAGCRSVFWLRTDEEHAQKGFAAFELLQVRDELFHFRLEYRVLLYRQIEFHHMLNFPYPLLRNSLQDVPGIAHQELYLYHSTMQILSGYRLIRILIQRRRSL